MRSIDEVIDGEGALRRLRSALAAHEALLARVRGALPAELAPHCVVATLDGQALRLLADSAGWGTRLRYLGPELVHSLRRQGIVVAIVEVRVLPCEGRADPPRRRVARPAEDAVACIEQAAGGVGDPALRAALRRLGRRLRR